MTHKYRLFEAFAGIGCQRKALSNIEAPVDVVGISEWNINSIIGYDAIHHNEEDNNDNISLDEVNAYLNGYTLSSDGTVPLSKEQVKRLPKKKKYQLYHALNRQYNIGSILDIDTDLIPTHDIFTYSFPCQDISEAGKRKGFDKDSGTKSSLLWECEGIISQKKPKVLLMENVKALINNHNKPNFDKWCQVLNDIGYTNHVYVLNAKHFGVPQNRERVFMISIRDEVIPFSLSEYDDNIIPLKSILTPPSDVPPKFIINDNEVDNFIKNTNGELDLSKNVLGTTHYKKQYVNIHKVKGI